MTIARALLCSLAGVVFAAGFLDLAPAAGAREVQVNCNGAPGAFKTLTAALAALSPAGPNTVLVVGVCRENVVIQGFDRLTIQGNPFATINGGSDPAADTFDILASHEVSVQNIRLAGGGLAAQCSLQSLCRFSHVSIQDSVGDGLFVGNDAFAFLDLTTIKNNAADGLVLGSGGGATLAGSTVQGNAGDGVAVAAGAKLTVGRDLETNTIVTVIQNNGGAGLRAGVHTGIALHGPTVSGNGSDGVTVQGGSGAVLDSTSITGNSGHGVRIGDLSFVSFIGTNSITGNAPSDITCDPAFSSTRGIAGPLGNGSTTNCPPEPPRNP